MNWIKITDALPEEGENVLAWNGELWLETVFQQKGFYYGTSVVLELLDYVTHWMRITPPEE